MRNKLPNKFRVNYVAYSIPAKYAIVSEIVEAMNIFLDGLISNSGISRVKAYQNVFLSNFKKLLKECNLEDESLLKIIKQKETHFINAYAVYKDSFTEYSQTKYKTPQERLFISKFIDINYDYCCYLLTDLWQMLCTTFNYFEPLSTNQES